MPMSMASAPLVSVAPLTSTIASRVLPTILSLQSTECTGPPSWPVAFLPPLFPAICYLLVLPSALPLSLLPPRFLFLPCLERTVMRICVSYQVSQESS
ncbi:hypothetical protein KC368_g22 [Hortaea werneckii]|nr:hypothetical protein KC368_g22 [Hortaea werneckii]